MTQRRQNLHSIISKISGNVDQAIEAETEGPVITSVTGSSENKSDDKATSEMKIADDQQQRLVTKMHLKEGNEMRQEAAIRRINTQLLDPNATPPFICELCSVAFLTKRELQLHVMCHGIHIAGNLAGEKVHAVIQHSGEVGDISTTQGTEKNGQNTDDAVVVNSEMKIVDVLSLATATRGFKKPGSIWCSLCKCAVDKGHTCKVYQTSYHAEKTEEGFTCELCGRFYNQKRKLRTHLRNRHKGFRLQEDEGYMCWQCWQAFPEIKILEEHIVQVHGHESRRQNSTWRPFTQPSTLPQDEKLKNADENVNPEAEPSSTSAEAILDPEQQNVARERTSGDIPTPPPAKKPHLDLNGVISVAEVDGKVVVTDALSIENPLHCATNSCITSNPMVTPVDAREVPKQPEPSNGVIADLTELANKNMVNNVTNGIDESEDTNQHAGVADSLKKRCGSPKHQCAHCSEKFPKKNILQLHIQEVHGENMHCFFCSTSCATKEVLASHIKTAHHEEVKNGKCPICQCKCLGELHQHIVQYHHKDLLARKSRKSKDQVLSTCPICHEATTDAYHLRWHILREHPGLQLSKDLADGEDTGSESGSSVSSERRLSSEGSERVTDNTMGKKSTSEASERVSDNTRGQRSASKSDEECSLQIKQDELEIVFVSDKNIDADWSSPRVNGVCSTNGVPPRSKANGSPSKNSSDSPVSVSPKTNQSQCKQVENCPKANKTDELSFTNPVEHDYQSISDDTCVFCFKKLTKDTLSSHLQTDHGWVDTFTCPVCNFKDDKYLTIVQHFCQSHFHPTDEATPHSDAKCLKCDIIFQDISHLKKHSSALHSFQLQSQATYNTFKCRHCNIIFEKQFDAQKHFDVYHLFRIRFKCESCRMGFTAKHDFQEHVTCNHPELVKCFCPVCGLGFEVSADLEEHVFEMHRRKAQFFCAQCGNEFSDRFHVHMHIRSNCCVTWADSNFECLDCLTAFSTINELRIHCKQRTCKLDAKS